jgi:D-beta-D-heptose 7-phosphate kinase/D-beta-D-heptose 1-phosphate adenosyltransferase
MKTEPKKKSNKNIKIVAVSGGFDPIHIGHIRMFKEAKKLGDKLVVILNNDHWLMKKKGVVFMPQRERKELIEAIQHVDKVMLTQHKPNPQDMSVCQELQKLRPHIFAQGGDRNTANIPPCEVRLQKEIGFKIIQNMGLGGKIQSSSWLLTNYLEKNKLTADKSKEQPREV